MGNTGKFSRSETNRLAACKFYGGPYSPPVQDGSKLEYKLKGCIFEDLKTR